MSIVDRGRESGFRWPLTAYVRQFEDGTQTFGLADLSKPGAYVETDSTVEIKR